MLLLTLPARFSSAVPAGWTMESIGPIAANVEDVLLV